MGDPKPIETAPDDGRLLLLFGYLGSGKYDWWKASWSGDYDGAEPYWRCVLPGVTCIVHNPTHWLPYPEPPVVISSADA